MEKKVGKLLFLLMIILGMNIQASEPSVVFRLQDMNHKSIEQVMCHACFILQVELNNVTNYNDNRLVRDIVGLNNFEIVRTLGSSQNVSIHNGKRNSQAVYEFVLVAPQKGSFVVGPLVQFDGALQEIRSQELTIHVADEVICTDKNKAEEYFFKIEIDKKQAYVGQKIRLKAEFYDRVFVDNLHLKFPEYESVHIAKKKNNITRRKMVLDGYEYEVTEWTFDMYVTQPGEFILQNITAAFFASDKSSKFGFGGMINFFNAFQKVEQYLIANPVKIDVLPLPESKKYPHVSAVGQFEKLELSIQSHSFEVGQGVTLMMRLHGKGNFEIMHPLTLQLPEHFNYYDSNVHVFHEQKGYKQFEYIMQVNQAGDFEIKPQTFVYFDPQAQLYKTLSSNALQVSVVASQLQVDLHEQGDDSLYDQVQHTHKKIEDFELLQDENFLQNNVAWTRSSKFFYAFLWFLMILIVGYDFSSRWLYRYFLQNQRCRRWYIFFKVGRAYKKAYAAADLRMLHHIFVQLFAELLDVSPGVLHDQDMTNYLIDHNFSDEQVMAWQKFYHHLLQASFFDGDVDEVQVLFDLAAAWIQLLKGKI